jgi:hypothetical protein
VAPEASSAITPLGCAQTVRPAYLRPMFGGKKRTERWLDETGQWARAQVMKAQKQKLLDRL